jgi:nitrate/nitrite-specific signal transduction histidine kinase
MLLKTKIKISTVIIIFISFIVISINRIQHSSEAKYFKQFELVDKFTSSLLKLNLLTYECIESPKKRILNQWEIKYNKTLNWVYKLKDENAGNSEVVDEILKKIKSIKSTFTKLKNRFENYNNMKIHSDLHNVLSIQLIHEFREIDHNSSILKNNFMEKLDKLQFYTNMYEAVFIAFVLLLILYYARFIFGLIFKPLDLIKEKIGIIGSGNLDVRLNLKDKNEIGMLADTIDTSLDRLKKVTASKEDLDKEINEKEKLLEREKLAKECVLIK